MWRVREGGVWVSWNDGEVYGTRGLEVEKWKRMVSVGQSICGGTGCPFLKRYCLTHVSNQNLTFSH